MDLFRHGWWGHMAGMVGVSTNHTLIRLTGMVLARAGVQTTIYSRHARQSRHARHGWCHHQPYNPIWQCH